MRLKFSRRAERDLQDIADHIRKDSPRSAYLVVRRLRANAARMLDYPLAAPLWPELPGKGLRRSVSGSYLIFYRLDDDTLHIVRILHGARDAVTLFMDEP